MGSIDTIHHVSAWCTPALAREVGRAKAWTVRLDPLWHGRTGPRVWAVATALSIGTRGETA